MKILLFGQSGQVGSALLQALPAAHEIITTEVDIGKESELRNVLNSTPADIIINAAAYTHVDKAESESALAFAVNGEAPRMMAETAQRNGSLLIHYSTDYVFNGEGNRPWVEEDAPSPLNIYGQSKLEGENFIINSGCRYLIFRTSWVYDMARENFVTKIVKLSKERGRLQIVSDQIGAPTSASLLAKITFEALNQAHDSGLYHICSGGETSWFDYARYIIQKLNPAATCQIEPVLSEKYPQIAKRPLNSRLNCSLFQKTYHITLPHWQEDFVSNMHLYVPEQHIPSQRK